MGPKRLLLAVCTALTVLLCLTMPATADDGSPDDGWDLTLTEVEPPSQQQIDDARDAMRRVNQIGHATRAAAPAVPREETAIGGPGPLAGTDWWTVGAGAFLGLVAVELIRGIRWRVRPRAS